MNQPFKLYGSAEEALRGAEAFLLWDGNPNSEPQNPHPPCTGWGKAWLEGWNRAEKAFRKRTSHWRMGGVDL